MTGSVFAARTSVDKYAAQGKAPQRSEKYWYFGQDILVYNPRSCLRAKKWKLAAIPTVYRAKTQSTERTTTGGVVVTRDLQVGNGIEFIDMAPGDRVAIERFLRDAAAVNKDTTNARNEVHSKSTQALPTLGNRSRG